MDLATILIKMAVSPVKADRDAITRIEREAGQDIQAITRELENLAIVKQAEPQQQLSKKEYLLMVAHGCFFGCAVGVLVLLIRPQYAWVGFTFGFLGGIGYERISDEYGR